MQRCRGRYVSGCLGYYGIRKKYGRTRRSKGESSKVKEVGGYMDGQTIGVGLF